MKDIMWLIVLMALTFLCIAAVYKREYVKLKIQKVRAKRRAKKKAKLKSKTKKKSRK